MAELRSTTAIGGNIVWHGGNLRFDPQGETIRYQGYKIYTEHDTPLPGELGNGGTTSAFTKAESDARFAPIAGGGYVQKIGDTMTGKLTNTANEIEIRGGSPRLLLQDNDGTKRWYLINDGGNFSLRENDTATTRFRIDATAANFGIENIDINAKTAFRGFDSWLRINDQAAFTTGVYFGSSLVRTDGTLQVGSATASGFVVNTTAIKYKDNNVFHDGYHPNADKWTTARTLTTTLTGDVSGSASMTIDGSANATVTVTATVANDSHTHDGRYYTETESDARFANVAGDTFTGNVAISKAGGRLSFNETDYANNNSGINWITSAGQNLELIHEIIDGDINTAGGNGQALIIRDNGSIASPAGLEVEGEIFAKVNQRVFHDAYHPNADKWTTARTLTIGNTGKSVDGTSNVTWTAKEITGDFYGGMYKYRREYAVNINAPAKLLDQNGAAITQGSIRVRAVITGTGTTDSASSATFTNINGAWTVVNTTQSAASSNRINFFIDVDGDPAVSTWHTSNYTVEVYHEFVNTGGNYHSNFWGIDGVLSSVDGVLKYGSNNVFHDGYHPNADKWTTARTLTLNGDVSGAVSFDGSSNATMTVTVANDSHTHDGRYYTESESDARFAQNSEFSTTQTFAGIVNKYLAKVTSAGVLEVARYIDFHTTNSTADYDIRLDCNSSGNISVIGGTMSGSFVGPLSGNASTATTWANARTLTIGNTGKSVNGSANVAWSLAEIGAVSKAGDTINGQLTIRHTNVQLNLMDSTYSDNYWQLDHQNGVMAFRYNGSASDDFRLNENGTAVFAHSVTAPTFVGSLSGNATTATSATTATTATYLGSSLISSNGGQDFKIRDKRALVGTTSNLIVNYGNDFTDVTVQSALLSTGRMTAYGSAASYAYASHYTSQAPFYHYKSSSGSSEYHAFMKGDINHSGGRYQHSFGAILSSSGAHTAQIVSSLNSSTTKQWSFQYSTGNFTAPGNVTAYSDRRLKKNIKLIDNALNKVGELNGYTYDKRSSFDSDEYIRETGVIAQEVEKVLPEAVMESDDEDRILSVAYGNMNGLLIEAIKELNAKVDTLQNEVQELKRPWWKKLLRL
ncbi:UNVERIFIED_ORG: hypothetical protein GCAPEGMB_00336 [Vibrio phage V07]